VLIEQGAISNDQIRAIAPQAVSTQLTNGREGKVRAELRPLLRRLQLGSGVVLLIYLSLHLVNHALGIWSLDLAGRGLMLALWVWHSVPGTILLYGAALLHFALAVRTIYGRRHWALPPDEWIRLWAGLSLPLLLIRHAVTTRLAASLYGFEPNYERIVISLITSGTQGLQLALLAPGWIHGCLGVWFRLRHHPAAQRARPVLSALLVLLPLLSAVGFLRMKRAVVAMHAVLPAPDSKLLTHQLALDTWRHSLVTLYLAVLASALLAGLLRNWLESRPRSA
jgi:adenylate cyclase